MASLRRPLRAVAGSLSTLAVIALVLRTVAEDSTPVAAWVHYFLPLPILALLLGAAALVFWAASSRKAAIVAVLVAALVYAQWDFSLTFDRPCEVPAQRALRVLEWNVGRGHKGWNAIFDHVAAARADLVGLVETGRRSSQQHRLLQERFSDYRVVSPGGGLMLLARGNILTSEFKQLIGISSLLDVEVEIHGRRLRVLLVDLDASPWFDKRLLIERIFASAGTGDTVATLVLGDFNAPLDSRWFRPIRANYTHAYEQAGSGRFGTWPATWPFLGIDHIWSSRGMRPTCARLEPTALSDHVAFHVTFAIDPLSTPR